jgi:ATP-dependent phosphoenolpyruvate carboxykinase
MFVGAATDAPSAAAAVAAAAAAAMLCQQYVDYMTSSTSIDLDLGRREMVILGTSYAGEMKKGIFT